MKTKSVYGNCIIYRHPKQKLVEFYKAFEKVLDNLNNKKVLYYIGGDYNIDLIKYETNNLITQFVDITYDLSCIPLITQPTRVTSTSTILINHVYTNNVVNVDNSFIMVSDMSDHFPVVVNSNSNLPKRDKSEISYV